MKPTLIQTIQQIMKRLGSALTLDELYTTALTESLAAFGLQNGALFLNYRATGKLCAKCGIRNGKAALIDQGQDFTQYQALMALVLERRTAINIPDLHATNDLQTGFENNELTAVLCVPIAIEQRILGMISIESTEQRAFDTEDEQLLSLIGDEVAWAIESHMQRDIAIELSKLSVEKVLAKIAEVACFLFGARSSAVMLTDFKDPEKNYSARFPTSEERPAFIPRPEGITYKIVHSGEPLVIQDVQTDPTVKKSTKQRGIQSILGVPLHINRQSDEGTEIKAVGALLIDILENRSFSEQEKSLLQSLANQASIAIEKERHTLSLRYLNQISLEITSSEQDIRGLAGTLVSHAAKLVNAEGGRLCLFDETGTNVQVALMTNLPGQPVNIKMDVNVGVIGHVLRTQRPFAKSQYNLWPERRRDFDKYGFTAVAGVPIIYQDHLWGVILVHDIAEGRVFDQEDLELLANLGNNAAVAFSNISRYDDISRIIESTAVTVIAVDTRGRITHFNQQAEEMLQYKKAEMIGKSVKELYYYEAEPRRIQAAIMASPDGSIRDYQSYLRSKKGQKIPIKLSASLLSDYEGKRSGSVGFFHDERRNEARVAIAGLLDRDKIFQAIVDQAWHITGASHSAHLALNIENKLQVTAAVPTQAFEKKRVKPISLAGLERIGISGRAFVTGTSQLVANVTEDVDYIPLSEETRSELAVPIISQDKVIGVIDVQHPALDAFNQTDLRNLETLAQFAAIAIQNAEMYEASQANKRKFETLAEIIQDTARNLDVNVLLRSTCRRLQTVFAEREAIVSIRLYDKIEDLLRFEPQWHESFHQRLNNKIGEVRTTQRLDEGICGHVAKTREAKIAGDVEKDPYFLRLIEDTRSEVAIPIQLDENRELIGVLDLQSPFLGAFSHSDLEYLQILADHLAIGIDKAKLLQGATFGKVLLDTAGVVVGPLDLEKTLEQITRHVYDLAKERGKSVNSVVLRLVRESKRILATAQPPELMTRLQQSLREVDIHAGVDGRIGISSRAIVEAKTQNVGDVSGDPDYMLLHESTRSELAIPIIVNGQVIAIMDIECAEKNSFVPDDVQVFEALAMQAGIAINSTSEYQRAERRRRHQQAISQASYIISRNLAVSQKELLDQILEQAVEVLRPAVGTKVNLGVIHLYDEQKQEMQRESIYPKYMANLNHQRIGQVRSLDRRINARIGINGRAILEGRRQRVDDVRDDPDYYELRGATRSELDVLIFDDKRRIIGVLGLESDEVGAFDKEDEDAVISLADLAGLAIHNARQYQLLQETKYKLATHTAVAWLGAVRGSWEHRMKGHIAAIFQYTRLLDMQIANNAPKEELFELLSKINQVIEKTREQRITTPLSPEEGREKVLIEGYIYQWLGTIDRYIEPDAEVIYEPDSSGAQAAININPGWFKLAIDNIVNNALRAMKEVVVKRLRITSAIVDGQVELLIQDTGPGIPPHIQRVYGEQLIERAQGAQGEGIGLMLSSMIIRTYGGEMGIQETSDAGTTIFVRFPCEEIADEAL